MLVERSLLPNFLTNTFLVGEPGGAAFFVDAGGPVAPLIEVAEREGMTPTHVLLTHHHYDHADADEDINVVFPIDVLRELESEGFIGGIAKKHIGYMGYTMQLKAMYEGTAREIANEIDRGSRADAVVLTGG